MASDRSELASPGSTHPRVPAWQTPRLTTWALIARVYRKNAERYDKEWWLQHKQTMAGGKAKLDSGPIPDEVQADLEPCGPVVRSGYYEADIAGRRVYPIYWPEAPRMLMRGTWFVQTPGQQNTLLPLPHSMASKLEDAWQQK